MFIEHNKKVKLNNPTPYTSGSKAKPNPTMGKPNPAPQQVHQHSQDDAKEEPPPDTSAQTLVNTCLAESGIDPTDIQNVMSVSHAKRNISSHDSSRKILNQGDSLTWRILTEDTHKIIIRSGIHSALRTTTNQRPASPSGEGTTLPFPIPYPQQSTNSLPLDPLDASTANFEQFVTSQSGNDEDNPIPMANIDIPNLLGRSFLLPPEDNGERHMAISIHRMMLKKNHLLTLLPRLW